MNRLPYFILFFLFSSSFCFSQTGYLFLKKGFRKKQVYTEGDAINVKLQDESYRQGIITLLRNDTVFINGQPVYRPYIKEVLLKIKPKKPLPDAKTMLLIGAGAALTSLGLSLNNTQNKTEALIAGPAIGFGPLLIKHFGSRLFRVLTRKKFRIGKKFRLQVLDFYIPRVPLKSF
jgi:hypothetical protein